MRFQETEVFGLELKSARVLQEDTELDDQVRLMSGPRGRSGSCSW